MGIRKFGQDSKKPYSPQQTINLWIIVGGLIIVIVSIALAGFFWYQNFQLQKELIDLKKGKRQIEGQFCGGVANTQCPEGYKCVFEGGHPDAGGKCTKE